MLALSQDGWRFGRAFLLRWEPFYRQYDAPYKGVRPGYEYPSAVYHKDKLHIAYSRVREAIEVSAVDVLALMADEQ